MSNLPEVERQRREDVALILHHFQRGTTCSYRVHGAAMKRLAAWLETEHSDENRAT